MTVELQEEKISVAQLLSYVPLSKVRFREILTPYIGEGPGSGRDWLLTRRDVRTILIASELRRYKVPDAEVRRVLKSKLLADPSTTHLVAQPRRPVKYCAGEKAVVAWVMTATERLKNVPYSKQNPAAVAIISLVAIQQALEAAFDKARSSPRVLRGKKKGVDYSRSACATA